MLTAISFDVTSHKLIDSSSENKTEISVEEKESEETSEEKMTGHIANSYLEEMEALVNFDTCRPFVNQLYLNTIFKPPIFS